MIAETAYYLAEKRGFLDGHCLDDWLAAEQQVRRVISPARDSEDTVNEKSRPSEGPDPDSANRSQHDHDSQRHGASHFERFAATQAAGDGVQGDTLKGAKSTAEKIGANMADRK